MLLRSTPTRIAAAAVIGAALLVAAPGPAQAATVVTAPITDRGLDLVVRPFAQLPTIGGQPARVIGTTTQGARLFVTTEQGPVFEVTGGTAVLRWDFAALWPQVAQGRGLNYGNVQHGGLRGMVFSPTFATDRKVYTAAMEDRPASTSGHHYLSDATSPIAADSVVSEWTLDPSGALTATGYRELFRVGMPVYDHPVKELLFGPDGKLYVAHGDGSIQSAVVGGGLNDDALGKILRIDPTPSATLPYTVPADNPFVGSTTMIPEAWSIGHRNPHTLSFTRDGTLLDTEVGRDNVDEINVVTRGGNYGWPQREGTFVQLPAGGIQTGVAALPADDAKNGFTYPVAQVGHNGPVGAGFIGIGLAGGYPVENGSPADGEYLYAEFATTGQVFHSKLSAMKAAVTKGSPAQLTQAATSRARILFDQDGNPATAPLARGSMLDVLDDAPTFSSSTHRADLRFGKGSGGEIYVTNKSNGIVYLIETTVPGGAGGFTAPRTRVEAETGTVSGGARTSANHRGFSGGGFVEYLTQPGAAVDGLVLNRQTAGSATLTIGYAAGSGGPTGTRTLGVAVDGTRVAQARFAPTGRWDAYRVTTVAVPLKAGANRIKLGVSGADTGWVNVDHVEVTDQTAAAVVQAESGAVSGGARIGSGHPGFTGTGFVEYLTAPGAAVSGLRLTTPTSGALTVRFAAGPSSARGTGPRTLSLAVDGGAPQRVTFPYTGSWSSYATVRVPVALPAGPHVLSFRYGTGDSGYVNLDSIAG